MKKLKTKAQLVASISDKLGITRKEGEDIHACIKDILLESIERGESISLFGAGMMHPVVRKSYQGVNPNTGKPWTLPESTSFRFSLSARAKAKVNAK